MYLVTVERSPVAMEVTTPRKIRNIPIKIVSFLFTLIPLSKIINLLYIII